MKTLIINGSPHVHGDTAALLEHFLAHLYGDYFMVRAYTAAISPCVDCRRCRTESGCVIEDEMQMVYRYLSCCDHVVIASPVYFSELTGKLLDIGSRLQVYDAMQQFQQKTPLRRTKKGVLLLTGGGDGSPEKACSTARCLLHRMGAEQLYPPVCSLHTDQIPAREDQAACMVAQRAAAFLNGDASKDA
ncbi:MAG: flavodoxin family protein [Ruminococcus sp.]|nr:flavodoxin family protein [Ruminococcus sp.]